MIMHNIPRNTLEPISTKNSWNNVSHSPVLTARTGKSKASPGVSSAWELVQTLSKIQGVKRVRAIAPRPTDLHWLQFDLALQPDSELSDESWEKIQDLIIDAEWSLRDSTQEKWYFHAEVVENYETIREGAKVIVNSDKKSFDSSITHLTNRSDFIPRLKVLTP